MGKLNKINECYECQEKRPIPGDLHIRCNNPDPDMKGHEHGIKYGWFIYPLCFDPVWKAVDCVNFEQK